MVALDHGGDIGCNAMHASFWFCSGSAKMGELKISLNLTVYNSHQYTLVKRNEIVNVFEITSVLQKTDVIMSYLYLNTSPLS